MRIFREDKLHIVGLTEDFVESLHFLPVSFMRLSLRISSLTISQSLRKEFSEQIF